MYIAIGTILSLVFYHWFASFPGWDTIQIAPLKPSYVGTPHPCLSTDDVCLVAPKHVVPPVLVHR
jgi:hypothetical protein